jgi:hypothetical protein
VRNDAYGAGVISSGNAVAMEYGELRAIPFQKIE